MKRKGQEQSDEVLTDYSNEQKLKQQKMSNTDTSTKNEKYDRQLRLWGVKGQQDLEKAHVCLINVTAVGTEILKCLILPGIGRFTIIDGSNVSVADLGSNFFFESTSLGKHKSEEACRLLQDLNHDSLGSYYSQDPMELLENNPKFYEQFTIIISSRLSEQNLLKLSNVVWESNIPLVICDTFGFIGYIRMIVKEHVVTEAQPDNALEDFRLDCPSHEMQKYVANINLETMDQLEHSHTPYLVILYKYLEKWRRENNSDWPNTYVEKRHIRDMIREGILKNDDGVPLAEENFEEAIKSCNSAFISTRIPDEVNEILNKSLLHSNRLTHSSVNLKFWSLVEALREFVKLKGVLPVRGTLPDMFSDSKRYIELQNIYKNMANCDAQLVSELVIKSLNDQDLPPSLISFDDVKLFCKNAHFLRVIPGLSYQEEIKPELGTSKLKDTIESASGFGAEIYLVFRALNRFYNNGSYPFKNPLNDVNDLQQLTTIATNLIQELNLNMQIPLDYFQELLRNKLSDFHVVASILGGICSQEIVKLITKQFIPVDNILLFNGMTQVTSCMKL